MVLLEKSMFGMDEVEINAFLMQKDRSEMCDDDSCKTADWNCPNDT